MNEYWIDVLLSCFLHTPLNIMFWRGAWHIQDVYFIPEVPLYNHLISVVLGISLSLIIYLTQSYSRTYFPRLRGVPYFFVSRLYTLIFGFGSVSHWRGLWLLMDYYTEVSWISVTVSCSLGILILVCLKSYCTMLAPPVVIGIDCFKNTQFVITTRFQCNIKKSTSLYMLDVIFTVVVIQSLVVVVWRGLWEILDLGLYPDDSLSTTLYSFLIGYSLMVIAVLVQLFIAELSKKLYQAERFVLRLVVEDVYVILLSILTVSCWRGLWYIQDLYLFTFNIELSYWVSLITGCLGLVILGTFNSVVTKGCFIDGADPGGQGVICDVGYFSRSYDVVD
ncbi:hypothetical protein LOTGIDRAFT_116236 [Lottia gigantea]|uniref:Uncharacterized protein n=1 Tax=Lottia gigantea TaxID=225164 RepID=V4C3N1_LOTGI|nr:hypothetical protein LOTGIDRAFT_116236 [Lottia gigantea]ESO96149.1 hypothetical protein LOTGIDRAFT_116236 [Lottia gigantea]